MLKPPDLMKNVERQAADALRTLLEQVSASCQLRFNRVFLRSLISRLQNAEQRASGG